MVASRKTIRTIPPDLVKAWLALRGWSERATRLDSASLWVQEGEEPREAPAQLVVPEDPGFDDFYLRMLQVVDGLASLYGRSADQIIADLYEVRDDVLRFRSIEDVGQDGSIAMRSGIELFDSIRNLLGAAAKATKERRPYFGRSGWNVARSFLDETRLGQTGVGSYVVTIASHVSLETPLDEGGHIQRHFSVMRSRRRIILETLMRSLTATREAVDAYLSTGEIIKFQDGVAAGVSADLCDALILMNTGSERSRVDVNIQWSPLEPVPGEVPDRASFAQSDVPVLRIGSKALKESVIEPQARIVGWVEALAKSEDVSGGPGIVTIIAEQGLETKGGRVRAGLSAEDHAKAHAAYGSGDRVVVEGDLTRQGTRNWLLNGRLEVLGDGPAPFV